MSLEWPARSSSLAWSNPVVWWWGLLALVSGVNIAVWFVLYRYLEEPRTGGLGSTSIELMLLLCAAYVFGCAFRSFLPRADVQRICLFDTWLSSVMVGRSVATVAEICFVAQWAIILHQLGTITGAHLERRVGDRAVDPDRGMLLMACGADQELLGPRHRKLDMGRCLLHRWGWPLPVATGV
jgi:hypothetical protein